jgi:hypothetical protein
MGGLCETHELPSETNSAEQNKTLLVLAVFLVIAVLSSLAA